MNPELINQAIDTCEANKNQVNPATLLGICQHLSSCRQYVGAQYAANELESVSTSFKVPVGDLLNSLQSVFPQSFPYFQFTGERRFAHNLSYFTVEQKAILGFSYGLALIKGPVIIREIFNGPHFSDWLKCLDLFVNDTAMQLKFVEAKLRSFSEGTADGKLKQYINWHYGVGETTSLLPAPEYWHVKSEIEKLTPWVKAAVSLKTKKKLGLIV